MTDKACSNCKWHVSSDFDGGHICVNGFSDYCSEYTRSNWCCDQWEEDDENDDNKRA